MNRKEILQKLSQIKLCVANLTVTYDMGLQFDVLTSSGVTSNMGNIGSWPCNKIEVTEDVRKLKTSIIKGDDISESQMMAIPFCENICTYSSFIEDNFVLSGDSLTECLGMIKKQLEKIDLTNDYVYVYAYIEEWEKDIKIFNSKEGLADYFKESWGCEDVFYDDMSDEDLEHWYNIAEENEWNALPCYGEHNEDDDE